MREKTDIREKKLEVETKGKGTLREEHKGKKISSHCNFCCGSLFLSVILLHIPNIFRIFVGDILTSYNSKKWLLCHVFIASTTTLFSCWLTFWLRWSSISSAYLSRLPFGSQGRFSMVSFGFCHFFSTSSSEVLTWSVSIAQWAGSSVTGLAGKRQQLPTDGATTRAAASGRSSVGLLTQLALSSAKNRCSEMQCYTRNYCIFSLLVQCSFVVLPFCSIVVLCLYTFDILRFCSKGTRLIFMFIVLHTFGIAALL